MENTPDPSFSETQHADVSNTELTGSTPDSAQPELLVPPVPAPNRFFFGRFGLRAGYGILIVLVVWGALATISGLLAIASQGKLQAMFAAQAYAKAHPHAPRPSLHLDFSPGFVDVQDGITFFALLAVCWLFSRGERRPLRAYGLGAYRSQDILPGAFWGVAMMSILVAALRAMHLLVFDKRALSGVTVYSYGLGWLFAFLLVGLSEEYTFRGYVQYALMRGVWGLAEKISAAAPRPVAFWLAAGAFSLLFALAHTGNGGENLFGLFQVFLAGITFAYALWRTGSLWWGVGFHMAWDWAQSFLFGVADSGNISIGRLFVTHPQGRPLLSGGADGPEGSIFATIALLLTIVIIRFTTRPGMQPALEQGPRPIHSVGTGAEPVLVP